MPSFAVWITLGSLLLSHAVQAQTTQPTTRKTTMEAFTALKWDNTHAGHEIDLSQYNRTFNDDFKKLDIVKEAASPGPGAVWFPRGHGAYRDNSPLRKDGPFSLVEDGLRCRVEKVGKNWKGACMMS